MEKVTIEIDGQEVEIEEDKTILDAAEKAGIDIPTLCYNELWDERPETCRMCVVETKGNGPSEIVSSCTSPVTEGLKVETDSAEVYRSRRNTLKLLLTQHTQDCRNCPDSGNCELSELSKEYDVSYLSVCADCSLQEENCLLNRGILCLGPISYSGCTIVCPEEGYRCVACRGLNLNEDIMRFASETYENNNISIDRVIEEVKYMFSGEVPELEQVISKVSVQKEVD